MAQQCKSPFFPYAGDLLKRRFKNPFGPKLFMISDGKTGGLIPYFSQKKRSGPASFQADRNCRILQKGPVRALCDAHDIPVNLMFFKNRGCGLEMPPAAVYKDQVRHISLQAYYGPSDHLPHHGV